MTGPHLHVLVHSNPLNLGDFETGFRQTFRVPTGLFDLRIESCPTFQVSTKPLGLGTGTHRTF